MESDNNGAENTKKVAAAAAPKRRKKGHTLICVHKKSCMYIVNIRQLASETKKEEHAGNNQKNIQAEKTESN